MPSVMAMSPALVTRICSSFGPLPTALVAAQPYSANICRTENTSLPPTRSRDQVLSFLYAMNESRIVKPSTMGSDSGARSTKPARLLGLGSHSLGSSPAGAASLHLKRCPPSLIKPTAIRKFLWLRIAKHLPPIGQSGRGKQIWPIKPFQYTGSLLELLITTKPFITHAVNTALLAWLSAHPAGVISLSVDPSVEYMPLLFAYTQ